MWLEGQRSLVLVYFPSETQQMQTRHGNGFLRYYTSSRAAGKCFLRGKGQAVNLFPQLRGQPGFGFSKKMDEPKQLSGCSRLCPQPKCSSPPRWPVEKREGEMNEKDLESVCFSHFWNEYRSLVQPGLRNPCTCQLAVLIEKRGALAPVRKVKGLRWRPRTQKHPSLNQSVGPSVTWISNFQNGFTYQPKKTGLLWGAWLVWMLAWWLQPREYKTSLFISYGFTQMGRMTLTWQLCGI